jgi:hypothetical protein
MDLIWLRVVSRLRTFGYPLDKIVEMRNGLVRQSKTTGQYRFTLFEVYVVMALAFRRSAVLLVFDNGSAEPTTLAHMKLTEDILGAGLDDHIHISINAILQDLYKDRDLSPLSDTSVELDDDELELIVLLRAGNYEQIKIKQKDGKIELIECAESVDPTGRIIDLLQDGDYQDISIIQRDEDEERGAVISHISFGWIENFCPTLWHKYPPPAYGSAAEFHKRAIQAGVDIGPFFGCRNQFSLPQTRNHRTKDWHE